MALIGTLQDDFDDNSIDAAKWTNWGGAQVTESSQRLNILSSLAANYYGMDSFVTTWNLTGSRVSCQLVNAGNQSLASHECYPVMVSKDVSNLVSWLINNNSVQAYKTIAGVQTAQGSSFAYNSGTHKYFRIREAGGTVFWDWSTDGSSWTNTTSIAVASLFAVTSVYATIIQGNYAVEASTATSSWDAFNIITHAGAGTFAGTGAFTATGTWGAAASATFSGTSTFTAAATRSLFAGTNQWINETGAAGNYISTPNIAAFAMTDLDVRWEGSVADWTTVGAGAQQYLISDYTHLVGGFKLYTATGATDIRFQLGSTAAGMNKPHSIPNGTKFRLRCTRVASTGSTQLYMGTPETAWLSLPTLGTAVVVSAGVNVLQGTTPMQMGNGEGSVQFAGKLNYGEVRNGIDGTVVSRFDANSVQATGTRVPTTVVDSTGTWTMNGVVWSWNQVWAPVAFAGTSTFTASGIGYDTHVVPSVMVYLETTAGVWVDVTADFQQGNTKRGRNAELDKYSTGTAQLQFVNSARKYDPVYSGSPLYGYLDLRRRMKVLAFHAGFTYPIFLGYIDSIEDNRVLKNNATITTIRLSDYFKVLNKYEINGTSFASELSGVRIDNVLDIVDATSPRNTDAGSTTLQSGTYASTLLSHAQNAAITEFGDFFIQADGVIRFKSRDAALVEPLRGTYGDGVGEHHYKALTPSFDDAYIRNPVSVDRNGGTKQTVEDTVLKAAPPSGYGVNHYSLSGTYHNSDANALAAANYILGRFKLPKRRVVGLELGPVPYAEGPATYPEILSRELAERILVVERPMDVGTPIEQSSVIEGIEHKFSPKTWSTKFSVSPGFSAGSFWTLGVSTLGSTTVLYF